MLLALLLQLSLNAALRIEDSLILISDSTPPDLKSLFVTEQLNIQNMRFENAVESLSGKDFLFLIDLTHQTSFTNFINSISSYFEVAYLTLFNYETFSQTRFEVHMSAEKEFELISSLLSFLGLDTVAVLSSSDQADSRLAEKFQMMPKVKTFYYSDQITEKSADSLIVKILKTQGLKHIILIDSSSSLKIIERTIKSKKWDKPGVVLIRYSRCTSDSEILGTLQISEEGTESSKTVNEYHFNSIIRVLKRIDEKILNGKENKHVSRSQIIETLNSLSPQTVNLINFRPNSTIVGTFNCSSSSLSLFSEILYPGNTSSFIINPRSIIVLSIANGTHDPYYSFNYTYSAYLYQGANYAVLRSNIKEEIPKFELSLNPNDCGLFWYDANWYKSCFSSEKNNFGIGLITTLFSQSLKGNIYALRSLDIQVPHVSPLGASTDTNNQKDFPELVKLEATPEIFSSSRIFTLLTLGYRDIIVIGTNETAGVSRYEDYKSIIEKNGMRIANDEQSRFVNWNYHRDNFTLYKDVFQRVRNTKCTLVLILTSNHAMVLEALYDVGYRAGEILYVADTGTLSILQDVAEPYVSKRLEMVTGSLIFAYREFVGEYGMEIKKELLQMFKEVTFMCLTFDTVSVFKEAIKYLIAYGEDFEDYHKLIKTIRMNRFTGCLGNVFFESNGNTRSSAQVLIQQIYYNKTEKTLRTIDIANYNRFSSLLYEQFNEFVWPTGSMPPNYLQTSNCLSNSKSDQESTEGKKVLYYLSFGLFMTTVFSGIISYLKNRRLAELLQEKSIISFEDITCYSFYFLELLQFIAMGPDQEVYKVVANNLNLLISFDLEQYFSFEFERFWQMFYSILALSIIWIFFAVINLTRIDSCFPELIQGRLGYLFKCFLYIVGHLLFLPFTSMIFNIFSCYRGTGDDLNESYLKQDCRKHCYRDEHKIVAILSYIVLTFFLSLATYMRPKLQYLSSSLHIKTKPLFLIIETLLHVTLVIFNKTLKTENQTTHGIVLCLILSLFFIFTYFYNPYNFKRPLVCHCGFIFASIWAIFTSTVFHGMDKFMTWIIIETIGFMIIFIITTVILKRCPEILYSEKGTDVSSLFIFQFCKDYEKRLKNHEDMNFLKENKYVISDSANERINS